MVNFKVILLIAGLGTALALGGAEKARGLIEEGKKLKRDVRNLNNDPRTQKMIDGGSDKV